MIWSTKEDLAAGQVDYNYCLDHVRVSERHGISVFYKGGDGHLFHTYSTYARGVDMLNVANHYLDLVPKGRDEAAGNAMSWLRPHDEYPEGVMSRAALASAGPGRRSDQSGHLLVDGLVVVALPTLARAGPRWSDHAAPEAPEWPGR